MNKDYRNHNNFLNKDSRVFIIAEMSGNHNQSLSHAIKIVEAAAKSGVDAIKVQTYTADTMTIDSNNEEFLVSGDSIWKGRKLYDIYKSAHTPWEWHKTIFKRATELGLLAFSTPFDSSAVDFLEIGDQLLKINNINLNKIDDISVELNKYEEDSVQEITFKRNNSIFKEKFFVPKKRIILTNSAFNAFLYFNET